MHRRNFGGVRNLCCQHAVAERMDLEEDTAQFLDVEHKNERYEQIMNTT